MAEKELFWEDFTPGRTWTAKQSVPITTKQIIAFAAEYDPLDIHIDPDLARSSPLGVHCASGVQTFGISQRLMCDALFLQTNVVAGGKIVCTEKNNRLSQMRYKEALEGPNCTQTKITWSARTHSVKTVPY